MAIYASGDSLILPGVQFGTVSLDQVTYEVDTLMAIQLLYSSIDIPGPVKELPIDIKLPPNQISKLNFQKFTMLNTPGLVL